MFMTLDFVSIILPQFPGTNLTRKVNLILAATASVYSRKSPVVLSVEEKCVHM